MRLGWFVVAILIIVATLVVVAVGSNLLEYVKTETSQVNEVYHEARTRGYCLLRTGRNLLLKIFPVSAVKILVVVLEIITQVYIYIYIFILYILSSCLCFDNADDVSSGAKNRHHAVDIHFLPTHGLDCLLSMYCYCENLHSSDILS